MNVRELEELLGVLPSDMPVLIDGSHIEFIYKHSARRWPKKVGSHPCDCGAHHLEQRHHR